MATELDYTYPTCRDRATGRMRYRPGFRELCPPQTRRLPLYLDSAAYREFSGGAPAWSSHEAYCEAIELLRPDGAIAKDVVGDQRGSQRGYERMCADGYRDLTIPVWQVMPAWVDGLSAEANAALAARDPVLRGYVDRAPLVAIGGLNQSPCRRGERHLYLQTLCRVFPDVQLWGLGQFVGGVPLSSWLQVASASVSHRRVRGRIGFLAHAVDGSLDAPAARSSRAMGEPLRHDDTLSRALVRLSRGWAAGRGADIRRRGRRHRAAERVASSHAGVRNLVVKVP